MMEPHNHEWEIVFDVDQTDPIKRTYEVRAFAYCIATDECLERLTREEIEERLNQHEQIIPFEK